MNEEEISEENAENRNAGQRKRAVEDSRKRLMLNPFNSGMCSGMIRLCLTVCLSIHVSPCIHLFCTSIDQWFLNVVAIATKTRLITQDLAIHLLYGKVCCVQRAVSCPLSHSATACNIKPSWTPLMPRIEHLKPVWSLASEVFRQDFPLRYCRVFL